MSSPRDSSPSPFQPVFEDIRFGLRALRSARWFSLVTVLTLAVGIGAGVAMFDVLHAVFVQPLPFPDAGRLVVGRATFSGRLNPWVAGADYYDYRDASDAFDELAAVLPYAMQQTVSDATGAEFVSVSAASANLLGALRVQPALGRGFQPADGWVGAGDVALLSHGFWQRRFGGDAGVVGRTLLLDGGPYTIVGVLPPGFFFMTHADVWLPMRPDRFAAASRDMHNWYLVGRLRPGVTLAGAQAGVDVISARLQAEYPETNRDKGLRLTGLRDVLTADYRPRLWMLAGAVALLLLIACGNGAAMLLARAPARRSELAVRGALGAPRARLVRQLLAESLGQALLAGAAGTLLAVWFQAVILNYLDMTRLALPAIGLSRTTVLAAVGLSLLAGLLAGLYPALRITDAALAGGLRSGARGAGDGGARFRSGLVVAQVAVSVVLLAASGLLVRSLSNLRALDPGFAAAGLLTAEVQVPHARYPDAASRTRFYGDLLARLRAMPGVASVALTSHLPIADPGNTYRANAAGATEGERIFLRSVFPGTFETLGIPLLAGRDVDEHDAGGADVVVLSRTAARRMFPGVDPLGKTVELQLVPDPLPLRVVGVVGDARLSRLADEPEAALYVPYARRPRSTMSIALRTGTAPLSLAGTLRRAVRQADPEVPVARVATLESLVSASIAQRTIVTFSLTLLALLPLILAAAGLFAVLAYHVARRHHELGVRMALGADAGRLGGMVLVQGMRLVGLGAVAGLVGAVALTRFLRAFLFGVGAIDPLTFAAVTALVVAAAALACSVPAYRAARADPRSALAAE
ncbi:MAG TPA: ABC transporter permease [Longimicrobiales bacterium]|nr:ABC transporter permease [Longimicrobiales bacterium]